MRLLTTTLLALLMIIPAGALATRAAPDDPAPLAAAALDDAARYAAIAASFPQGAGLGAQLTTLTGAGAAAVAPASFDDAMASLYEQAGVALPADYARPEPALAAALAPVVQATADAARLMDEAFSGLTPDERAFALANLHLTLAPSDAPAADENAARVQEVAARVDIVKIRVASATLAGALDAFQAPSGVTAAWLAPGGFIEVGSTGDDRYCAERLLILDLGGNDWYDCHAASYAPGSALPLPVSAILDLAGNDVYLTSALHASSLTSTWGQAVGIGGIGLIVDRWGDDVYETYLGDAATYCSNDFYTGAPQYLFAQAVGALGVGAILDASGNDFYYASNFNTRSINCHFGWVYAFAQGVGLLGGVGLIVDDTGDDNYLSFAYAVGKYDNMAAVFSQAAAAGGIGALVDKEGSDRYYAEADGYITPGFTKGAFAYVFSQASVTATRRQPAPALGANTGAVAPQTGLPIGLCATSREGNPAGTSAGSCDGPGIALLIDVLGNDRFDARTDANDFGLGCYNGLWSVVSAQGSAAWTGVAALLNLDVEGSDSFDISPTSRGTYCGYPGVRAHAYGQGYGGPVLWDFWDLPLATGQQVPVGVLASLGIPEETCPGDQTLEVDRVELGNLISGAAPPSVDPAKILKGISGDPCTAAQQTLPHLTASPDAYHALATAWNPSYTADATTYVQGASLSSRQIPAYSQQVYTALGIGANLDVGGDDSYVADATADGPSATALVVGQAGTNGGIAGLANVGGTDAYNATALVNAVADLPSTLVQGYAVGGTALGVPSQCFSTPLLFLCTQPVQLNVGGAVAVFVELFGIDGYSEAAERTGCHANGSLLGTWPVGAPLGPAWWGTVIGHPCSTPATDTGSGSVVGVDWWSEAY
ncbi:MAG TPA: hypothetical protein VM370_11520 [Candidatus Thermoplasmatota archaeon]|nr:hypothetical protein [Candidatus Thermoplasmatota archaeon]